MRPTPWLLAPAPLRSPRRPFAFLLAGLLVALVGCGSSGSTEAGSSDDESAGRAASGEDAPTVAGSPLPNDLEISTGPVSLVAALSAFLPEADDIGDAWAESIFPAYELPASCKPVEPVASVGRNLGLLSTDALGQQELSYSILLFASEADAVARVEWLESAEAKLCDSDFSMVAAEILEQSSAGAFRIADEGVNSTAGEPRPLGAEASAVVGRSALRGYEVTYIGGSANLEVQADSQEFQIGRYVVRYERSGPADPGLVEDGDPALERVLMAVEAAADDPVRDSDLDALGERLRQAVPINLIPSRYRPFDQAVFLRSGDGGCEEPPDASLQAVLEGPAWLSRQARAIEQLRFSAQVFNSALESGDYLEQLREGGTACLASLDLWPSPAFTEASSTLDVLTVDGIEILELRSSAEQHVADITVGVETVIRVARHGEIVITIQYVGLVGDGDYVVQMLVEALARLR